MVDSKISDLAALATPDAADLLEIVDVSATANKKITVANLLAEAAGLPSQWTDGGNGDVTATVDDVTKTAITVQGLDGQTADLLKAVAGAMPAYLTIDQDANTGLTYTARANGIAGNAISIEYIATGLPGELLTVAVVGNAIAVTLATDGSSNPTSTANAVRTAVAGHVAANALVAVTLADGSNGTGVLQTFAQTLLANGVAATDVMGVTPRGSLTVQPTDKTQPAIVFSPPSGASSLATAMLQFLNDAGDKIGDWDAEGNIYLYDEGNPGPGLYLNHIGQLGVTADAGVANPPLITEFKQVNPTGTAAYVWVAGQGQAVQIQSGLGDAVLALSNNENDEQGVPSIVLLGPPSWTGVFKVLAGGAVLIGQNVAPDSSLIGNGQMALWFDSTNGAAKLRVKAKSADGTVVSGEVALS